MYYEHILVMEEFLGRALFDWESASRRRLPGLASPCS